MTAESTDNQRDPRPRPDGADVEADEATGQIPTAPDKDRSAEKAREESGQGPARGVVEEKKRK